jgi:hypothetical protein
MLDQVLGSITFFAAERFNNEREFNYAGIHCEITH